MKVECTCKCCKKRFMARVADRKRGWGQFCSKSCKAIKQNRTKPYTPQQSDDDWSERMHQWAMEDSTSSHGQDEVH